MDRFTIRVELHGAREDHYELLHSRLAAIGCNRFITGNLPDGTPGIWALPTAEYDLADSGTAIAVRDRIKLIADSVKPGAWVLVTKVESRAWSTLRTKATST